MPTQAAAFTAKKVTIDGMPVEVAVWDTAGQERFHALGALCGARLPRLSPSLLWPSILSCQLLLCHDPGLIARWCMQVPYTTVMQVNLPASASIVLCNLILRYLEHMAVSDG